MDVIHLISTAHTNSHPHPTFLILPRVKTNPFLRPSSFPTGKPAAFRDTLPLLSSLISIKIKILLSPLLYLFLLVVIIYSHKQLLYLLKLLYTVRIWFILIFILCRISIFRHNDVLGVYL